MRNPYAGQPSAIEAGRQLFLDGCSPCHGPSGEGGRGPSLVTGREVRRSSDERLFGSIKNGLPGTDMPPFPQSDEKVWHVVTYVRSLSAAAIESNVPGDVGAGRTLFFGAGGCTQCHMMRGQGGYLGPDLTDIGMNTTLRQIQESLLEPNVRIKDGFAGVTVTTLDGQQIVGIAKYNTNYSIQLLDREGKLHLLRKKDLRDVVFREKSWMPADYATRFTQDEIQSLLAFLSRQSIRMRADE